MGMQREMIRHQGINRNYGISMMITFKIAVNEIVISRQIVDCARLLRRFLHSFVEPVVEVIREDSLCPPEQTIPPFLFSQPNGES